MKSELEHVFTQAAVVLMGSDGTPFLSLAVWMANILIGGLKYFNTNIQGDQNIKTPSGAMTTPGMVLHIGGIRSCEQSQFWVQVGS